MSNEIANYNPGQASLLEMRADATRFPRINTMSREQAVSGLIRIVSQAFLYRGQAADPVNVQFISNALLNELLEDDKYGAGYLSLAEIQVIVKRAVLGGIPVQGHHGVCQGRGASQSTTGLGAEEERDRTDS